MEAASRLEFLSHSNLQRLSLLVGVVDLATHLGQLAAAMQQQGVA